MVSYRHLMYKQIKIFYYENGAFTFSHNIVYYHQTLTYIKKKIDQHSHLYMSKMIQRSIKLIRRPKSTPSLSLQSQRCFHGTNTSNGRVITLSSPSLLSPTSKSSSCFPCHHHMHTSSSSTLLSLNNSNCATKNHLRTSTRNKVFVSRHNQSLNVTSSQINEYCKNQGIAHEDLRNTNTHVIIRECPFCNKPTRDKADNMFKMYVQIGGGAYFCHRCGSKGEITN